MADKIKAIKIKQINGTYSEEIPISVNVQNVQWDENNHTLLDALGSVDISSSGKGNLQHQIDELDGDKISTNEFNSRLNDFLKDQISADTTDWLDDNVNPVGSAVIVDKTLTIEGAAADALAVRNAIDAKTFPIDNTLSDSSTNPVQNRVVTSAISELKADLDAVAFPTEAKEALVNCLKKVSWSNETDGEGLMNALEVALGITPSQRREELPAAYEQVTHIYGIAGQYINTGIKSQIPLEIQCEAGRGMGSPVIGAYNGSTGGTSRFFQLGFVPDNSNVYIGCRYANDNITIPGGVSEAQWLYSANVAAVVGEMYTVTSGIEAATNSNNAKTYINVDGTRVEVERAKPALGNDIMLFNITTAGTNSRLRLGYFKAYSGSTLLADYIPCYRKSDNVAGFYDVVSKTFKVNQGSGSFEVGDVVY